MVFVVAENLAGRVDDVGILQRNLSLIRMVRGQCVVAIDHAEAHLLIIKSGGHHQQVANGDVVEAGISFGKFR